MDKANFATADRLPPVRRTRWLAAFAVAASLAGPATGQPDSTPAARVAALAQLHPAGVTELRTEIITSGTFLPPAGGAPVTDLPPFCRVAAVLRPTPDSNIRVELWLPLEKWNGRLLGTGNGGGAGKIIPTILGRGLQRGFAAANTDLGTSPDADSAIGRPERWADFGHRATHEMTVAAKAMVAAFYGRPAQHAYFMGGSTGGQQALMEAQRFPEDYDGILAIAPASNRTHLHTYFLWNWRALNEVPGQSNLSPEQIAAVTRAVVRAGAGRDGGAPGDDFLTDPRMCRFDPATLLAPQGGPIGRDRLSLAQVDALKKIYAGPVNPRTRERIYPPPPLGSESALLGLAAQEDSSTWPAAQFYLWRWVFGGGYDYTRFDFDRDLDLLDQRLAAPLNANDPDLSGFRKRGGKLIVFSGTADPVVPFQGVIQYYERAVRAQGGLEPTQTFFRLFIVPGMGHSIRGGPGLNDIGQGLGVDIPQDSAHDSLFALVHWVEDRVSPDQLIATAFKGADPAKGIRFQRPVYPYPKFPHYQAGDVNAPSSYIAVDHDRGDALTPADKYLR